MNSAISTVTRLGGRAGLLLKKSAPTILTVSGVIGVIGSAVLVGKGTLKLEEELEAFHQKKNIIDHVRAVRTEEEYTKEMHVQDLTKTYGKLVYGLVKLYAPAVSLGVLSIAAIASSHNMLQQRNVALVGAYKAVESAYSRYRERVIEEEGVEKDRHYRFGGEVKHIDVEVAEGKTISKEVVVVDKGNPMRYARFFDETCKEWEDDSDYNMAYLLAVQDQFTNNLRAKGHVFLNEVYEALGIPLTPYGQIVGWVYGEDKPGDDFVDFGMTNPDRTDARLFVNGYTSSILLDFNVAGVVHELI